MPCPWPYSDKVQDLLSLMAASLSDTAVKSNWSLKSSLISFLLLLPPYLKQRTVKHTPQFCFCLVPPFPHDHCNSVWSSGIFPWSQPLMTCLPTWENGSSVGWKSDSDPRSRPRPVLIKMESCWDERLLLAACCKLKGYSYHKLFERTFHLKHAKADD